MKSADKIFRNAVIKLTVGICMLFPLINVGYFVGLWGLTTIFKNSAVTKSICSIEGPDALKNVNTAAIGISETCAVNGFWRSTLVLGSLLVLLIVITWWYVRRALKPIRFAHNAQRQFSSSALHQMQTPLTIMRSHIDNAKITNPTSDLAVLESLTEELITLERTTKSLVQLSKPATTQRTSLEDVQKILNALAKVHKVNAFYGPKKTAYIPMSYEDVYMILDIAFGNIIKHSGTKYAHIETAKKFNKVALSIRDKGQSFKTRNKNELDALQATGHGIGLNIITIITHKYGGTLKIKKVPSTTLIISLPKN
jgi:signal transduction histidine kinase